MAGGSLSKCQSPPPVPNLIRRTATPENPNPAEVITEVQKKKTHVLYLYIKKKRFEGIFVRKINSFLTR